MDLLFAKTFFLEVAEKILVEGAKASVAEVAKNRSMLSRQMIVEVETQVFITQSAVSILLRSCNVKGVYAPAIPNSDDGCLTFGLRKFSFDYEKGELPNCLGVSIRALPRWRRIPR
mmetsp:Transcript_17802/g.43962  ORF Transcript_17802/g.43962 Transcript_17802/m.43962 type:complete len:116 (-) Transcript_17802:1261-1608(-)